MTIVNHMTVRDALVEGSSMLTSSESPWLDATLLLADTLGYSREKILASYPDSIAEETYVLFRQKIAMRQAGHPVAYLTGSKEFYGRDFIVREGILCPRPDTEILIEAALDCIREYGYTTIHDLCTGSGCIALTLCLENQKLKISASDISEISEEVFLINRGRLDAGRADFHRTSLLDNIQGPFDMIVSNPPYLTTDETQDRMKNNWKEPSLALDGGRDGLDLIREIVREAPSLLNPGGMLMMEADPAQMNKMEKIMTDAGFGGIIRVRDLASRERVIFGRLI